MRESINNTEKVLKWVVFDGPLDPLWAENLNSALDDNKRLFLLSGEIIRLESEMKFIFEVEDLN